MSRARLSEVYKQRIWFDHNFYLTLIEYSGQ